MLNPPMGIQQELILFGNIAGKPEVVLADEKKGEIENVRDESLPIPPSRGVSFASKGSFGIFEQSHERFILGQLGKLLQALLTALESLLSRGRARKSPGHTIFRKLSLASFALIL